MVRNGQREKVSERMVRNGYRVVRNVLRERVVRNGHRDRERK